MLRRFCDGCWHAGVHKDITDRNDCWRVTVDSAHILDLCPERCAPVFERFDQERQGLVADIRDDARSSMTNLVERFWKEVSDGRTEKPEPLPQATGTIVDPHASPW